MMLPAQETVLLNKASLTFEINGTKVKDAQISEIKVTDNTSTEVVTGYGVLGLVSKPGGYELSFSARQRQDLTGPPYEQLSNRKTTFDMVVYSFDENLVPVESVRYKTCQLKADTDYSIDGKMYSVTVTAVGRDDPENLV